MVVDLLYKKSKNKKSYSNKFLIEKFIMKYNIIIILKKSAIERNFRILFFAYSVPTMVSKIFFC